MSQAVKCISWPQPHEVDVEDCAQMGCESCSIIVADMCAVLDEGAAYDYRAQPRRV